MMGNCGAAPVRLATGISRRQHEWRSDGGRYKVATPVASLRTLETSNVRGRHEKLESSSHRKDELWKRDSDKLTAIMADAGVYLNTSNARNPSSRECKPFSLESAGEEKQMEMVKVEKRRKEVFAESDMLRNVDRSSSNVEGRHEKLESSHHKDELWKRDSDKLTSVIADARAYLNVSNDRSHSSRECMPFSLKSAGEGKQMEMVKVEKRKRNEVFADSDMLENAGRSFSGKRMKEGKASGTETMWEGDFLSPTEWNVLQRRSNVEGERSKPPLGKFGKKLERQRSTEFDRECRNALKTQRITSARISRGTKAYLPCERLPNSELTETKRRDRSVHVYNRKHDGALTIFVAQNHEGLINWEIVQPDHLHRCEVMQVLKLFKDEYVKLSQEPTFDFGEGKPPKGPHLEAASRVKAKGMSISPEKPFGHIPGIMIGDEFTFRSELTVVGLNSKSTSGINYVNLDGKLYATSVVDSGRYKNETKEHDTLIYSGEGGNPDISVNAAAADQKPVRGNLALINSMKMGYPIRVIRKRKLLMESKTLGMNDKHDYVYVYDGLYMVNKYWQERDNKSCKLVFKFELQRVQGQPSSHGNHDRIRAMDFCNVVLQGKGSPKAVKGVQGPPRNQGAGIRVLDDVSQGKEKVHVRVFSGLDGDRPPPFTYITKIRDPTHLYQHREPVGCNCIDGCSSSEKCPCVVKNGGKIPYNEKGELLPPMTEVVHECGPSCKCPATCMNRVSQHGLRLQLEIFKTKSMGWGVRSRDYIMPGSFICEYIGELLGEEEANQRIDKDEYLFHISHGDSKGDGFALDAAEFGNVGRFINHSCEPNVVFQKVLYDHDDRRVPHIMFFASKRIPPKKELTHDYKYSKIQAGDTNKNIRRKACECGSCECIGKRY